MKNIQNILLVISTIIIATLLVLLIQKPKQVEKIVYKEKKCDEVAKLSFNKSSNYVLLGDSITNWYPIEEFFPKEIPIVKSGVAGYQTKDLIDNVEDMVIKYNPTKIFILIGTNDLENIHKEQILENVEELIRIIKKERQNAEIYFESILPVNTGNNPKVKLSTVGGRDNEYIKLVNNSIKEICKNENINYLDIYKEFVGDDSQLQLKYTEDGLHLSELGYYKMTNILLEKM